MTDVKALPENIEQLEQLTEFKRVYKKYTVDQLETQLIEKDVEFLSADSKADLVWRLLDHRGFNFEAALAESEANQPAPADDKDDANEDVQANQDDADSDQVDSEANADTGSDSASADDSTESMQMDNTTNNDAPSDIDNSDDAKANQVEQPAETADQPTTDKTASNDEAPTTKTLEQDQPADEAEKDHVVVLNIGSFPFYETATNTMVPAKKTTKIYPTASVGKDQILRNVKQYNHTRGNKLRIIN